MAIENENIDEVPNEEVVENEQVSESVDTETIETTPEENNDNDFDPTAFGENAEVKDVNIEKVEDNIEAPTETETLDWVSDDTKVSTDDDKVVEVENETATTEVLDEAPKGVSQDSFKQVAEELGLKFETIDEMKDHLKTVEEENNKLRNSSGSGATSEAIQKLEGLRDKDNEELVKLSLEKDGFSGEELDDAVDRYVDNGLIDIEAKKIRNTINNAIVKEQNKVTQSTVDADAKQQQEHSESVRKLEEHINKTNTMFGFNMAKDEDSLKQVQQGHAKYITSGNFLDDVFRSDESLAEAAWFVRNKKVIINAIANKNLQKGKQAILDDIREPEVVSPQRFRSPDGSNEFDPSKFTA